jgi:hypothetical protein
LRSKLCSGAVVAHDRALACGRMSCHLGSYGTCERGGGATSCQVCWRESVDLTGCMCGAPA